MCLTKALAKNMERDIYILVLLDICKKNAKKMLEFNEYDT